MMVTNVRGHFKNVHGALEFDEDNPRGASVEVTIDARPSGRAAKSETRTRAAQTSST
jgi:polyisoprenoid-binding protein YceI